MLGIPECAYAVANKHGFLTIVASSVQAASSCCLEVFRRPVVCTRLKACLLPREFRRPGFARFSQISSELQWIIQSGRRTVDIPDKTKQNKKTKCMYAILAQAQAILAQVLKSSSVQCISSWPWYLVLRADPATQRAASFARVVEHHRAIRSPG